MTEEEEAEASENDTSSQWILYLVLILLSVVLFAWAFRTISKQEKEIESGGQNNGLTSKKDLNPQHNSSYNN